MENEDPFFNNDPHFMMNLIGKSVRVTTIEDKIHEGVLYVIDPITKTVVLKHQSPENSIDFILYSSIKCFNVTSESVVSDDLIDRSTKTEGSEHKRKLVKDWLQSNLIDIKEDGSVLKLGDELIIIHPYGPDQCLCNNVIVLERIRKLLAEMPSQD